MTAYPSRRRSVRAQSIVEYALVLPVLLLILLVGAWDYFESLPQEKLDTASLEAVASALAAPGGAPTLAKHYIDHTFTEDTKDAPFTTATIDCPPPSQVNGNNEYIYSGRVVPGTWIICNASATISLPGPLGIWVGHYKATGKVRVPPYRQCAPGVVSC